MSLSTVSIRAKETQRTQCKTDTTYVAAFWLLCCLPSLCNLRTLFLVFIACLLAYFSCQYRPDSDRPMRESSLRYF